jgi:prepilin-type N-terminal cleavage/methylation domain-containing protein
MRCSDRLATSRRDAGFTLLEIAVALAVIGFAIVAVLGVLPTGLNIQRDTRERTIVTQDATYLIEAIRRGAFIDSAMATNLIYHVEYVARVTTSTTGVSSTNELQINTDYSNDGDLVRLLGEPHQSSGPGNRNFTVMQMRSLSGTATEKGGRGEEGRITFNYLIFSEVIPITSVEPTGLLTTENLDIRDQAYRSAQFGRLGTNLAELRFTIAWPATLPKGGGDSIARNQLEFRSYVSGLVRPHPAGPPNPKPGDLLHLDQRLLQ